MRILTYNVNGIRSAIRKGFLDWLRTDPADIICLQEIKAAAADFPHGELEALGYHVHIFPAQKKGYSGVAILTKHQPDTVLTGDGRDQSDTEGRVLRADYGDITVLSAYFPSGTTGEVRQTYKYQWLEEFAGQLELLSKAGRKLVICGDYNIAHREIDIHNPKANKDTSGFLPEERAWMDRLFANGLTDGFRHVNPEPHQYSWWSYRANARANNKGWRIDYISVSDALAGSIARAEKLPDVAHSDHCPVRVEFVDLLTR